ncbi:MAG: phosphoglycerate kinase [Proteobacteria bacterium]|nr:phosphoglycerate kinase [Pseudomonadota bacterium]
MEILSVDKYENYKDKTVLIRCDYNVPMQNGKITDDTRIIKSMETLKYILDRGASVVLMSHLGKPEGKKVKKLSLLPVKKHLEKLLGKKIGFIEDITDKNSIKEVKSKKSGAVTLLENLRFYPGEEKDDESFAKILSQYGDIYVNEAFSVSHRKHASVHAIGKFFDLKLAGFLMEKEIEYLKKYIDDPKRPFAAVIGGAKISSKIDVLMNLIEKVDILLIGGGMAFTFLKAQRYEIGKSIFEEDKVPVAMNIMNYAGKSEGMLLLPVDAVIADDIEEPGKIKKVAINKIPRNMAGLDIGPKTEEKFISALIGAKTILWNGPMGVFEKKEFSHGTLKIARAIAEETAKGAISILGGGDTISAVNHFGMYNKFTHVSTGGGASLDFMGGKEMPGIEILKVC